MSCQLQSPKSLRLPFHSSEKISSYLIIVGTTLLYQDLNLERDLTVFNTVLNVNDIREDKALDSHIIMSLFFSYLGVSLDNAYRFRLAIHTIWEIP